MSSIGSTSNADALDMIPSNQEHEVFLNFRGPDTRAGITDHLYRRFIDANIGTYKDDEELRKGEEIGSELLQAINKSTIALPIFSKRYAESIWCLKELIEIAKCRSSKGMKVMPIFYYVTPSEVRTQTGNYEEAFKLHEQSYETAIVREWKDALSEIGALSGWEIPSNTYRQEGKLIDDVTKEISFALKKAYLEIPHHLVGLGHHVEKILSMLSDETHGVQIIGIHGMGGIGKTTLAKFVYNHLLPNFEGSSFLSDTRSKDMEFLKKSLVSNIPAGRSNNMGVATIAKRFSNKKVLVVLDDVDKKTHIEELIGEQDLRDQFGMGSKIILTTRDRDVLRRAHVHDSYELRGMDFNHSLQLFCRHAFRNDAPKVDYAILSKKIVETTGGLPLALEVIGSSLREKSKEEWESKFEKLKDIPPEEVRQKLRISYDELDDREQHIFLDIACFFIGHDQSVVIHFWDPRQLYPKDALNVLQHKSLIKVKDNLLWMHDQLRDMGREIVRKDNIMSPEKQTRLWDTEVATKVFMTKKGAKKIQGINVELNDKSRPCFTEEEFAKLPKVKLFWVETNSRDYRESWRPLGPAPPSFFPEKPHIFSELRWLQWQSFPHKSIETSNFTLSDLTILDLSYSTFTHEWAGWSHIKTAENLKVLILRKCCGLVRTPEFSSHLRLERLVLKECLGLVEIDKSICMLKHLVHLDLEYCPSLCKLPREMGCMGSLTELIIDKTPIAEIPHWGGMARLEVISACESTLKKGISLNKLTSLKKLLLKSSKITSIPDSIGDLVNLVELCLHKCRSLKKLPESIGGLVSLTELDISSTEIEELPNSIGCLKNLKLLIMYDTPIRELPTTIGMGEKLEVIDADKCEDLCCLPMLPQSLIKLAVTTYSLQNIPDLSNLINLTHLSLSVVIMPMTEIWWIGRLSKLEELHLGFNITKSIPKLPSSLTKLKIVSCWSLEALPDLSHLKKLSFLEIVDTPLINVLTIRDSMVLEIDGLPMSLRKMVISDCKKLKRLPQMSNCKKLAEFSLRNCPNLVEIQGRLESVQILSIQECESLVKIPDVWNVKCLRYFLIGSCRKLFPGELMFNGPVFTYDFSIPEGVRRTLMQICCRNNTVLEKRKWKEEVS